MTTVYSKPNCVQCTATQRYLEDRAIPFTKIDISEDEQAYEYVMSLGHMQAPVVVRADGYSFSGFQPAELANLI